MLDFSVELSTNIGGLKTRLIGLKGCTFAVRVAALKEQMLVAFVVSTVPVILLFCDALLSMLSTENKPTNGVLPTARYANDKKVNAQVWMMII